MELHKIISENYSFKSIIEIKKTKNVSGNTYFIETKQEKYVVKINERIDFVNIYDKVQSILNQMNLLQSRIIKTNEGMLMTSEEIVLYEFIDGNNYNTLSKNQFENAIKYISKYNEALKLVPFKNEEIALKNHWDRARSVEFIIDEFPKYLHELEINYEYKENIYNAISILYKNKGKMSNSNKQLIHSDLGADNFIFKNYEMISIIDFTPEYNHELYSLCQFIYCNYLWDNSNINKDEINNCFNIYNFDGNIDIEIDFFYLLLINAVLYRIVGPLMDMFNKNIKDYSRLKKRFVILSELLGSLT